MNEKDRIIQERLREQTKHIRDDNVKGIILDMFSGLYAHEEKRLDQLTEQVLRQHAESKEKHLEICTFLCEKSNVGRFPDCSPINECERTLRRIGLSDTGMFRLTQYAFFNGTFSEYSELMSEQKTYNGKLVIGRKAIECEYTLQRSDLLVKSEKKLGFLADAYGFTAPLIYSPWSRRLVAVQTSVSADVLGDIAKQDSEGEVPVYIDTYLEQNGLSGKLMEDMTLMWNIQITSHSSDLISEENRLGDETIYSYLYEKLLPNSPDAPELKFLYIEPEQYTRYDLRSVETTSKGTAISMLKPAPAKRSELFKICTVKNIGNAGSDELFRRIKSENYIYYTNFLNRQALTKKRLFSEADIQYVLNCFSTQGVTISFEKCLPDMYAFRNFIRMSSGSVLRGEKERDILNDYLEQLELVSTDSHHIVSRYPNALDYQRRSVLYSLVNARISVKFTFNDNCDNRFRTDYANYVLSALEYRYPEYGWDGVI